MSTLRRLVIALAVSLALSTALHAQRGQGGRGTAPPEPPFDPTGYWVSLISDEWRYRMLTPAKGNVDYVPVNAEGRRVAGEWDPAKDEASGEACRGYGAGGVMRLAIRLHITWQDPATLKMESTPAHKRVCFT